MGPRERPRTLGLFSLPRGRVCPQRHASFSFGAERFRRRFAKRPISARRNSSERGGQGFDILAIGGGPGGGRVLFDGGWMVTPMSRRRALSARRAGGPPLFPKSARGSPISVRPENWIRLFFQVARASKSLALPSRSRWRRARALTRGDPRWLLEWSLSGFTLEALFLARYPGDHKGPRLRELYKNPRSVLFREPTARLCPFGQGFAPSPLAFSLLVKPRLWALGQGYALWIKPLPLWPVFRRLGEISFWLNHIPSLPRHGIRFRGKSFFFAMSWRSRRESLLTGFKLSAIYYSCRWRSLIQR